MTIRRVTAAQMKAYRDRQMPHYIYRCYDAGGRLVYIGCTVDAKSRMVVHRADRRSTASALLRRFMDHYEVDADEHPGRLAGQEAERIAIHRERPIFNQNHSGSPSILRARHIADYIHEKTGTRPPLRVDGRGWSYSIDAATLDDLFARAAA